MKIDVDVSGEDLLSKDYVVCIANNDGIIKGFKFDEHLVKILSSRYGQEFYRYKKSRKQKALFKVRIYSVIIYYLIKSIRTDKEINFTICKDFDGKEQEIKNNLQYFLEKELGLKCNFEFIKLGRESQAHQYSYLMRKDKKNHLNTYVNIGLKDIEKWL